MRFVVGASLFVLACGGGGDKTPDAATAGDGDVPVPKDTDGDGVTDDKDNCPTVQNPNQHDEDADGLGDACDLCPATPGSNNADADADDIGDVCDPDVGPDEYVIDSFHPELNQEWLTSGTWAIGADLDSWVQSDATAPLAVAVATSPGVQTAGSLETVIHTTGTAGFSFRVTDRTPATFTGYTAVVSPTALEIDQWAAGAKTVLKTAPVTASGALRLNLVFTATSASVTLNGGTPVTATLSSSKGLSGLFVASSSATFDVAYITWPGI